MNSILNFIPSDRSRRLTHGLCALITVTGWAVVSWLAPDYDGSRSLTVATGYVSLLFIVFTLIWGPFKLMTQKRNPVNLMVRRDVGIWAGITGVLHTIAGFQVHMGGNITMYFFQHDSENRLTLLTDLFGLSNYVGLFATILLIALLLISNDLSLRLLRGGLWKWLQRSNYGLILLVIAHAVGYQFLIKRAPFMTGAVAVLCLAVLISQLVGVLVHMKRTRSAVGE